MTPQKVKALALGSHSALMNFRYQFRPLSSSALPSQVRGLFPAPPTGLGNRPQEHFTVFRRQRPFAEGVNEAVFEGDSPNEGKVTPLRVFRGLSPTGADAKRQSKQPDAKPHNSFPPFCGKLKSPQKLRRTKY